MRESKVEKHLVARARANGGAVRKVRWLDRVGAPDRLVMFPPTDTADGVLVWVELKAPGKKPEPRQEREHAELRLMGQHVEVLDSTAAVDEFFERL